MLCQQCQAREATVHFSVVAWPSGDETNHLCESCYPKAEAERTASYNQTKPVPPVVEFERIILSVEECMHAEKRLFMAICSKCEAKRFVPLPEPAPGQPRKSNEAAHPATRKVPWTCPRCGHEQFTEH